MEITEDYVSFEVAKLLKQKGFDQNCATYYLDGQVWRHYHGEVIPKGKQIYAAPSQAMAMKWLRNKGIYIQIRRNVNTYLYGAIMLKDGSDTYATIPSELETYEEAVEAALKYVLENLI